MTIRTFRSYLFILAALVVAIAPALQAAQGSRGGARTSVNSGGGGQRSGGASANASANANRNTNTGNRNTNVQQGSNNNVNIDNSRNTNVNVDVDGDDWDNHNNGCCFDGDIDHPVAAMAATAAVIGAIVYSVPPSCVPVVANGITYQQCGSTWYQPQFVGTSTQYVVIAPPY